MFAAALSSSAAFCPAWLLASALAAAPISGAPPEEASGPSATERPPEGEGAPEAGGGEAPPAAGQEASAVAGAGAAGPDDPVEGDPQLVRPKPQEDEYPAPDAHGGVVGPASAAEAGDGTEPAKRGGKGEGDEAKKRKGVTVKGKGSVEVEFKARVMAGFGVEHQEASAEQEEWLGLDDDLDYGFQLRQARLGAKLRARRLTLDLGLDLADALESVGDRYFVRDAWANVEIVEAFQLRAGRFKRPFSRLQLTGVGDLPILGRGLFNGYAVVPLAWGDRGIGLMAWGKIRGERAGKLTWSLAGVNGSDLLIGSPDAKAIDTVARVEYAPRPWVSIGANGVMKYISVDGVEPHRARFAAGGDLRFRHRGLDTQIEIDAATDWASASAPWMLGVVGYLAYAFPLPKDFALQPAVFGEFVDRNLDFTQSEGVRFAGGLNLLWTEHLRVMPQVDLVRPLSVGDGDFTNSIVASETYLLILSVEL